MTHRDAAHARRHRRESSRAEGMPQNRCSGAPHCPADDSDDHRLLTKQDPGSAAQHDADATDPHARVLAPRSHGVSPDRPSLPYLSSPWRGVISNDEIADLDDMIEAIVKDLAPELLAQAAIDLNSAA